MPTPITQFTFLLVSDIHCAHPHLTALRQRTLQIDAVLCAGDLCNVNHPDINQQQSAHELELHRLLEQLASFQCPLWYVPGNHDPERCFPKALRWPSISPPTRKRRHSTDKNRDIDSNTAANPPSTAWLSKYNLHGQCRSISPAGVRVFGLGGSVSSYPYDQFSLTGKPTSNQPPIWPGYPFADPDNNHHSTEKQVARLLKRAPANVDILMVHCGPARVSTSDVNPTPNANSAQTRIETGSTSIREYILACCGAKKSSLSLVIHGHSHKAWGLTRLGDVDIINPGPLRDGRYAVITMVKGDSDTRWRLGNVSFECLL